jgi:hypothetical protein
MSTIFWDAMLCSLIEVHWRFRGSHCLCLQVQKYAKKQQMEAVCSSKMSADYAAVHFRRYSLHSCCCENLKSNNFQDILFIVTVVRTSNPTTSFLFAGYEKYWLEVILWFLQTHNFCLVSTITELQGWKFLAADKWVKPNYNLKLLCGAQHKEFCTNMQL